MPVNNISFNRVSAQNLPAQRPQAIYFRGFNLEDSPNEDTITISNPISNQKTGVIKQIKNLFGNNLRNTELSDKEAEFYKRLKSEKLESGRNRFSNKEAKEIFKIYRQNPELIELFINEKRDDYKTPRFNIKHIKCLTNNPKHDNIIKTAIEKRTSNNYPCYNIGTFQDDIANLIDASKKIPEDKMIALINNYTPAYTVKLLSQDKDFESIYKLLSEGINLANARAIASDKSLYLETLEERKNNPMRNFLNSPDFHKKLQQNSAGKYQKEFMDIIENMNFIMKEQLIESGLSEEDFLNSMQKLSKSTFKLAYETPNQYLSDIDTKFTKPVHGKLPELTPETLAAQRKCIVRFFQDNIGLLSRTLKYVDTDTIAHMMDKRIKSFRVDLKNLNGLSDENFEVLSQLLKCKSKATGKNLSPKEKIDTCQIVQTFQNAKLDIDYLKQNADNGILDINSCKNIIVNKILSMAGIRHNIKSIPEYKKNFNQDYAHLIFEQKCDKNLMEVIKVSVEDDFNRFINDPSNEFGRINYQTKLEFEDNNLNYKKWQNPEIEEKFKLRDKNMTIKLWDRNPQEDLFIGNKTTCCTAIGTGANKSATPIYLLNTAFNVAELYDNNNNVVGMSRVFMAKVKNKPALIMDNIELNNTFKKNMTRDEQIKLRNKFFDYMNKYAEKVGGKKTVVYFNTDDINVPDDDLDMVSEPANFIGHVSQDVYINTLCDQIKPELLYHFGGLDFYEIDKHQKRNF